MEKLEYSGKKMYSGVTFFLPQIPHGLPSDQTGVSTVRNQRLTP